MDDLIPLFPLNAVLFPGMFLPLHVFEERYRLMVHDCLEAEREFGVVLIRTGVEAGGPSLPHRIGTTARIVRLDAAEDGRFYMVALGESRFRILQIQNDLPYLRAVVEPVTDLDSDDRDLPALARDVGGHFKRYIALLLSFADKWIGDFEMPVDPEAMSFYVAARLNILPPKKQRLVETTSIRIRLEEEKEIMRRESAQLELLASAKTTHEGTGPPS